MSQNQKEKLANLIYPLWMRFIQQQRLITERQILQYLNPLTIQDHKKALRGASIEKAHLYCVLQNLTPQQYGTLLEDHIKTYFQWTSLKASDCAGDCRALSATVEIKVSMGNRSHRKKFNYVQIRVSHKIDFYFMTAYYLCMSNWQQGGELYIFRIEKDDMLYLLSRFGEYAHGTIKKQGKITLRKLEEECTAIDPPKTCEYALRPVVGGECWEALMKYRVFVTGVGGKVLSNVESVSL